MRACLIYCSFMALLEVVVPRAGQRWADLSVLRQLTGAL